MYVCNIIYKYNKIKDNFMNKETNERPILMNEKN